MRQVELQKYKERLLSPMPKIKKYPKPKLTYPCNDFKPGEIAVFKISDGQYEGYYFAFQFLGQKEYRHYMARNDIGLWYINYGAFFNYFAKEKPNYETLHKKELKAINVTLKDNKYYFKYNLSFYYNQGILEKDFADKYFNKDYLSLKEMQDTRMCLRDCNCAGGWFDFDNQRDERIKRYLIDEPMFFDWDESVKQNT